MRVPADERKVCTAEQSKNWTCRGSFRLAQLAMLPVRPVEGARRSARGRPGHGSQLLVFYAEEVQAENEWLFQSALVYYRERGKVSNMWNDCSESDDVAATK